MNITKEELVIEETLEKKINNILMFLNIKEKIINGNLISLEGTNLAYIEPHKITINKTDYLFFNERDDVYINDLTSSIKINQLKSHIKKQ